jgi:hypothetical protein
MWTLSKSHWLRWTIIFCASFALVRTALNYYVLKRQFQSGLVLTPEHGLTSKPEGLAVRALIFYGRKDRAEILQCYLEVTTA